MNKLPKECKDCAEYGSEFCNDCLEEKAALVEHYWEFCDHCGHDVIICCKCGNNTCNGGHGTVDGAECDACEEAYTIYLNKMNNR